MRNMLDNPGMPFATLKSITAPFLRTMLWLSVLLCGLLVFQSAQAQPVPEICRGKKSCFITFNGPDRDFCQAYVEKRSCFMSFNDAENRGWCQYVREGKSCFMALNGQARADCEAGRIPREHRRWNTLCGQ